MSGGDRDEAQARRARLNASKPRDVERVGTTSSVESIKASEGYNSGTKDSRAISAEIKADEARATAIGNDPVGLYQSLGRNVTRHTRVNTGSIRTESADYGQGYTVKSTNFELSKGNQAKFDKAKRDFEARGGSSGTVESTSRGAGGGQYQTQGDFGPGAINIGGVKPLGG